MLDPGDPAGGARLNGSPAKRERADTALCLLLGAALFLPGIGARDLWNPDEPRYAEVAREMLATGELFVPHLNGEVYAQKPPLHFWAIAAMAVVSRGGVVDEIAARLPSVLAAAATIALVFHLGLRLFGRRAAWIAAAAFATSGKILWQGRVGQIDMLLVALVAAAVLAWVRSRDRREDGRDDRSILLFWLFAGLATVAKGPVGLLPPLFAILAFLALERDRDGVRRLRLGAGFAVYCLVVLAWLVPATLRGGLEYLEQIAFRQTVTRYADPWHHFRPWHYYLGVVPADFLPWSVLLPAAVVAAWRERDARLRSAYRFCACWAIVTIVFFSLSPAKRSVYVLTLYPALALLVGGALDRIAQAWPGLRRGLWWTLGGFALVLAAAAAAVPFVAARRAGDSAAFGPGIVPELAAMVSLLALAVGLSAWFARSGRVAPLAAVLAAGMALIGILAATRVLPRFDAQKSARGLSERLLREMAPGDSYAIYPRIDPGFVFYTRRFCELPEGEAALRAYVARPGRAWLLITRRAAGTLDPPLPLDEIDRDPDERDGYLLLGRRG